MLSEPIIEQFTGLTAAVGLPLGLPLLDTLDRSESFDPAELIVVVVAGWVVSVWSGMVKRRDRCHGKLGSDPIADVDDIIPSSA